MVKIVAQEQDPPNGTDELEIHFPLVSLRIFEQWNLRSLRRLKISCISALETLSGLRICEFLQELVCPFNRLVSLDELWGHACLEILDVESNLIADQGNWMVIHSMTNLKQLEIGGNSICSHPQYCDIEFLSSAFPLIETFNGIELRPQSRITTATSSTRISEPEQLYPKNIKTSSARVKAFPVIANKLR